MNYYRCEWRGESTDGKKVFTVKGFVIDEDTGETLEEIRERIKAMYERENPGEKLYNCKVIAKCKSYNKYAALSATR